MLQHICRAGLRRAFCVSAGEAASGGGEEAAGDSPRSAEAGRPHRAGQWHNKKKKISVIHPTSSEWMWCLSVGHSTQAGVLYASADGRQTVRDRESRIPLQEEWRVKKQNTLLLQHVTLILAVGRDLNLYMCVLGWGKCGRRGNVQFTTVTWPLHMPPWVYLCVCAFDSDWVRKEQNTICVPVLCDLCETETFVLYLIWRHWPVSPHPSNWMTSGVSGGSAVTPEDRKDRCFPCFLFFPAAKQTSNQTEPAHLPS